MTPFVLKSLAIRYMIRRTESRLRLSSPMFAPPPPPPPPSRFTSRNSRKRVGGRPVLHDISLTFGLDQAELFGYYVMLEKSTDAQERLC